MSSVSPPWRWVLAQLPMTLAVLIVARVATGPVVEESTLLLIALAATVVPGLIAQIVDRYVTRRRAEAVAGRADGEQPLSRRQQTGVVGVSLLLVSWGLVSSVLGIAAVLTAMLLDVPAGADGWSDLAVLTAMPGLVASAASLVILLAWVEVRLVLAAVGLMIRGVQRLVWGSDGGRRTDPGDLGVGELALGLFLLAAVTTAVPLIAMPTLTDGMSGAPRGLGIAALLRLVGAAAWGTGPAWVTWFTRLNLLAFGVAGVLFRSSVARAGRERRDPRS